MTEYGAGAVAAINEESFADSKKKALKKYLKHNDGSLEPDDMKAILGAFSFDDDKAKASKYLAKYYGAFSSADLAAILSEISFSSTREKVLKRVCPKVRGKISEDDVLAELSFSSEKELATKLLSGEMEDSDPDSDED
eukprot:TRINITY_DN68052_c3_g1_i2.p1 TRINITY_DN68052_c3_g1~~TRINITY_DN68052_c3_g1_i2.p1  ORF type:complete len:152 (+),score=32.22 TRINITY_DN68052_c3_g1_i2:44-457(+)